MTGFIVEVVLIKMCGITAYIYTDGRKTSKAEEMIDNIGQGWTTIVAVQIQASVCFKSLYVLMRT